MHLIITITATLSKLASSAKTMCYFKTRQMLPNQFALSAERLSGRYVIKSCWPGEMLNKQIADDA